MKLQDIKCKTSNQLNGFKQIFSDRFSGRSVKWPKAGWFSRKCMLWVAWGDANSQILKLHQDSSRITQSVNFFVRSSAFVIP